MYLFGCFLTRNLIIGPYIWLIARYVVSNIVKPHFQMIRIGAQFYVVFWFRHHDVWNGEFLFSQVAIIIFPWYLYVGGSIVHEENNILIWLINVIWLSKHWYFHGWWLNMMDHTPPFNNQTNTCTILKISDFTHWKKQNYSKLSSIQFQMIVQLLIVNIMFVEGHMAFQTLTFIYKVDQ